MTLVGLRSGGSHLFRLSVLAFLIKVVKKTSKADMKFGGQGKSVVDKELKAWTSRTSLCVDYRKLGHVRRNGS